MNQEAPSDLQNEPLVPDIKEGPETSLIAETLPESEASFQRPPTPTQQEQEQQQQQQQQKVKAEEQTIDEAIAASFPPQPIPTDATPPTAPQPPGSIIPTGQEQTGRWTREEQERFIRALEQYGKEWKKVAAAVQTRTIVQVRTHAQKFQKRLARIFEKGGEGEEGPILSAVEVETESVGGRMRLKVDEGELRRWRKLHVLFSNTHGGYGKN